MESTKKAIVSEIRDDKIAVIRLNREEKLNALSFEMFHALSAEIQYLLTQP